MKYVFYAFFLLHCPFAGAAQDEVHQTALAAADSTRFSPNKQEGWKLFNAYNAANGIGDSAVLELIIQHRNNINWRDEHFLGKIKNAALKPNHQRVVSVSLQSELYQLRIEKNGKCFLRLASGNFPIAPTVVLPLKAMYKL